MALTVAAANAKGRRRPNSSGTAVLERLNRRIAELEGLLANTKDVVDGACDRVDPDGVAATNLWEPYLHSLVEPAAKMPSSVVESFQKQGHVVLRGFFSAAELREAREDAGSVVELHRTEWEQEVAGDQKSDGKQFVRVYNLHEKLQGKPSHALRRLLMSPRLAKAAGELAGMVMNSEEGGGILHYQNQAFFKESADLGTHFHQDHLACPLDTHDQLITAWIPLVNISRADGLLRFASGSHHDMSLSFWNQGQAAMDSPSKQATAFRPFSPFSPDAVEGRYDLADYGELGPGDVTFHHGWTIHGSDSPRGRPTGTGATREALAISYVPASTRMLPAFDLFGRYTSDDKLTVRRLYGLEPGQQIPSSIMPRLWPPEKE